VGGGGGGKIFESSAKGNKNKTAHSEADSNTFYCNIFILAASPFSSSQLKSHNRISMRGTTILAARFILQDTVFPGVS
jgi:hypothetical protein